MNTNVIKKILSVAFIAIAVVLLLTSFFRSDKSALLGKWVCEFKVFEFYKDNTCAYYWTYEDGDAYNEESYRYKITGSNIVFENSWQSEVCPYELSKDKRVLDLDGELFTKASGINIPFGRYIVVALLLALAWIVNTPSLNKMEFKVKDFKDKITKKSYVTEKIPVIEPDKEPEIILEPEPWSAPEPEPAPEPALDFGFDPEPIPTPVPAPAPMPEPASELDLEFDIEPKPSEETKVGKTSRIITTMNPEAKGSSAPVGKTASTSPASRDSRFKPAGDL